MVAVQVHDMVKGRRVSQGDPGGRAAPGIDERRAGQAGYIVQCPCAKAAVRSTSGTALHYKLRLDLAAFRLRHRVRSKCRYDRGSALSRALCYNLPHEVSVVINKRNVI